MSFRTARLLLRRSRRFRDILIAAFKRLYVFRSRGRRELQLFLHKLKREIRARERRRNRFFTVDGCNEDGNFVTSDTKNAFGSVASARRLVRPESCPPKASATTVMISYEK